jgi:hypothetical protein
VDQKRVRQTPRPAVTFDTVLKTGAKALLEGAATATRLVGMPTLSAAISRVNVDNRGATAAALATPGIASGALGAAQMEQSLHQQRVNDDLKLLSLQDEIQRHNRQIQLVSNVMKARHDTAKAAIGNMRA